MRMATWWIACAAVAGTTLVTMGCGSSHQGTPDGSIVLDDSGTMDAGPGERDAGPIGPTDRCGDVRGSTRIFGGSAESGLLSERRRLAVGMVGASCSGTLIANDWILTSARCGGAGTPFCFGPDPLAPTLCIPLAEVFPLGTDLAVGRLSASATSMSAEVLPVPINTEPLRTPAEGENVFVESAGYGQNDTGEGGGSGARLFANGLLYLVGASPEYRAHGVPEEGDDMLLVDGGGMEGACEGDNGGPVLIRGSDGMVRVAGGHYGGDPSCVDLSAFTRTDPYWEQIVEIAGPAVLGSVVRCPADLPPEGECLDAQTAVFCSGAMRVTDNCPILSEHCALDEAAGGYRCVEGPDPCEGYDARGACDGDYAFWCEGGTLRARDCRRCDQICDVISDLGGAYCRDLDPCESGELTTESRCDGDFVEYCDEESGAYRRIDCGRMGGTCDWVNDTLGYWCVSG